MKTYKQLFGEAVQKHKLPAKSDGKMMTYDQAKAHFGEPLMKAVVKHPYFTKYIRDAAHGKQIAFRHSPEGDGQLHYIDITHGDPGNGIRNWVNMLISYSGRAIKDVQVYRNKDGERDRNGKLVWKYHTNPKQDKEDAKRSKRVGKQMK